MRKALLLVSLGFTALAVQSLGAPDKGKDLSSLKASYEKSLTGIITNYEGSIKSWPDDYVNALKALQTKMQKGGNLDGWQDAKSELDRFQADPKIPDDARSPRAEVQALLSKYRDLPRQLSLDKNQKITALSQKQLAKLTTLQTDLTKQGKMEEALAVNAEIKRVKSSPEVTAAEFELSEQEAKAAMTKKDTPPKEVKPGPAVKPPDGKEAAKPIEDGEIKMYEGKAPAIPGVSFKNMQLRPTSNVGAKRKVNVTAMVAASSDEDKSSSASYYSSSKSESGSTSSRVRLGLKTVASASVLENVIVVVEYYCKEVKTSPGKVSPEKMLVKRINVPKVDIQGVWIDCPEASTYKSSYRYTSSYGSSYRSKGGKEFYGAIISVFESDKTLAFQAVTGSALEEYATTDMPDEKTWSDPATSDDLDHRGPSGPAVIRRGVEE